MSDWAEIRTRPSLYDYLKKHKGVFQNFDFFHNGGYFKSIMAAILDLKWLHFGHDFIKERYWGKGRFPSYAAVLKREYLELGAKC